MLTLKELSQPPNTPRGPTHQDLQLTNFTKPSLQYIGLQQSLQQPPHELHLPARKRAQNQLLVAPKSKRALLDALSNSNPSPKLFGLRKSRQHTSHKCSLPSGKCSRIASIVEPMSRKSAASFKVHAIHPLSKTELQVTCQCRRRCNAKKSCVCKKSGQLCSNLCHPGHTCTNVKENSTSIIVSTAANHHPVPCAPLWVVVGGVRLYEHHRLILTSEEWLDDDIIRASQYLLKEQFPEVGGLQSPVLAQKCAMEPQTGTFIQVLNASESHWFTISNIGCPQGSLKVYDSLHWKLSSTSKKIVADLMMCRDKAITVTYVPVQWQSGGADCGLFALAFAASLCAGNDPATILYHQPEMRSHLIACLAAGKITPFPTRTRVRRHKTIKREESESIPVFCLCRLPDDGTMMIQCTGCEEWFHKKCVKLQKKSVHINQSWYCRHCKTL